jgi:hypothetical protein
MTILFGFSFTPATCCLCFWRARALLQSLVDKSVPPRERAARQYVIDAFRGKMPSLIPFAFENESILKLVAYLLRHTIGSKATLYQYIFGVYRFSK